MISCMVFLLFCGGLLAQQGPVAAGGEVTGAGGTVSYSVGQVDYVTLQGAGGNAHLGLQQPREFFTTSIMEIGTLGINAFVFPNPSSGEVTLSVQNAQTSKMSFSLFNTQGQVLLEGPLSGNHTRIDLNALSAGAYFVKLNIDNTQIKLFKIIKQ